MARDSIIDKLIDFLNQKQPFKEECEVLYLMVQIRKILEHDKRWGRYQLISYYSNWVVHPKKESGNGAIKPIIQSLYNNIKIGIETGQYNTSNDILSLLYLSGLQKELNQLFIAIGLPIDLLTEEMKWAAFIDKIFRILSEQPIIKPIKGVVDKVELTYIDSRKVKGEIV